MSGIPASDAGRVGVWFVGARGSVATTAVVGAAAIGLGMVASAGMVSELPELAGAGLTPVGRLVFGGHDVVDTSLPKRAEQLATGGVLPEAMLPAVSRALVAADQEIRPGAARGASKKPQESRPPPSPRTSSPSGNGIGSARSS
ncbi:hypothetical protein AB0A71_19975 [Kitasatospora aureofaciens]|uniref:hypothetical protein n=1 Tax=Kitasatospora aureofaciens TaxID=1894 RepID=UPI0033E4ACE4